MAANPTENIRCGSIKEICPAGNGFRFLTLTNYFLYFLVMGCCSSDLKATTSNSPGTGSGSQADGGAAKEDKIELLFKAKRANVFSEGITESSNGFSPKKIPKSAKQSATIRTCFLIFYNPCCIFKLIYFIKIKHCDKHPYTKNKIYAQCYNLHTITIILINPHMMSN